jgi:hypothetical protein
MWYKMETGRAAFVGDWVLKDVAMHHRTAAYTYASAIFFQKNL